jgi:hypothetical protein
VILGDIGGVEELAGLEDVADIADLADLADPFDPPDPIKDNSQPSGPLVYTLIRMSSLIMVIGASRVLIEN